MRYKLAVYLLLLVTAIFANAQTKPAATLVITNAAVYTVDKQHPKAEAVAMIGDRIVAVGSNAEIDLWRGPQTKVINAGGRLLLPSLFLHSRLHIAIPILVLESFLLSAQSPRFTNDCEAFANANTIPLGLSQNRKTEHHILPHEFTGKHLVLQFNYLYNLAYEY